MPLNTFRKYGQIGCTNSIRDGCSNSFRADPQLLLNNCSKWNMSLTFQMMDLNCNESYALTTKYCFQNQLVYISPSAAMKAREELPFDAYSNWILLYDMKLNIL